VPNVQALAAGLTGQDSVTAGVTDATKGAYEFGQQLKRTIGFVISIKDELLIVGGIIASVFVASKIVTFVTAIGTLITAMKVLRTTAAGAAIATAFATGGTSVGLAAAAIAGVAATYGLSAPSLPIENANTRESRTIVNNISVQAIDPEGAARAVQKVLVDSSARSTPTFGGGRGNVFQ
jgi:hypothetical protein